MKKNNILYFKAATIQELYKQLNDWQKIEGKTIVNFSVHKEHDGYHCLVLTGPMEVVITDAETGMHASVDNRKSLFVSDSLLL